MSVSGNWRATRSVITYTGDPYSWEGAPASALPRERWEMEEERERESERAGRGK